MKVHMLLLEGFTNFSVKHLCWSLFLIKMQAFRSEALFKKTLQHRCVPVKCEEFLRIREEHLQTTASVDN